MKYIFTLLWAVILISCNSSKKLNKSLVTSDSTSKSTYDSGWNKINTEETKFTNKSGKETTYVLTKDTVINNIYYPPQALPVHTVEYIYADGTRNVNSVDTGNLNKTKETAVVKTDETLALDKKTSWPITTWLVLGIIVYVVGKDVIFGGINLFKNRYHIIRKNNDNISGA